MSILKNIECQSTFHALTPACKEAVKKMIETSKNDFVIPPNLDDYSNNSTIAISYLGIGWGYAIITPLDNGDMWLSYIWIKEGFRNEGSGGRLFNDVAQFCNGKLKFNCSESNPKALRFFRMYGCNVVDYVMGLN